MQKFTIKLKVNSYSNYDATTLEMYLKDLLNSAVLPTLECELIPLTLDVKKGR